MEWAGTLITKAGQELTTSAVGLAIAFTCSGLSIAGVTPVVGPGRALRLALTSFFASNSGPPSVRVTEVAALRRWLRVEYGDKQACRLIIGEKGVGKSYMLRTALYRAAGVINVDAEGGDSSKTIRMNVLKAIGKRSDWSFGDPVSSAKRTIACYRFMFRRKPVVVINAVEGGKNDAPADIAGAIRTLSDSYNLRVIVESSPSSLDVYYLERNRENILRLERLCKEQVFSVTSFADLFKTADAAPWADIAWKFLGGNPRDFVRLRGHVISREADDPRPGRRGQYIGEFLTTNIYDAIHVIVNASAANLVMSDIIQKFREADNKLKLESMCGLIVNDRSLQVLSDRDEIFRLVKNKDGYPVLMASTNAIDIAIKFNMKRQPTAEELLLLLA